MWPFCLTAARDAAPTRAKTTAAARTAREPCRLPVARRASSLVEIKRGSAPARVLAPSVSVVGTGTDRYGFGLFDRARKQIGDSPAALYVARAGRQGPRAVPRARVPLAVKPAFQSETVANDPDAAKALYVSVPADEEGRRLRGAGRGEARRPARGDGPGPPTWAPQAQVPKVGDQAPEVSHADAKSERRRLSKIDTRMPPDTMHEVNFRDVVGKKPIILVFSTPALCQSRVCGPVADIAEEVKADTNPATPPSSTWRSTTTTRSPRGCLEGTTPVTKCQRPQVLAYHLPTEPWARDRQARQDRGPARGRVLEGGARGTR